MNESNGTGRDEAAGCSGMDTILAVFGEGAILAPVLEKFNVKIWAIDASLRLLYCNKPQRDFWKKNGVSVPESGLKISMAVFPGMTIEFWEKAVNRCLLGESLHHQTSISDNSGLLYNTSLTPINDQTGTTTGILVVTGDTLPPGDEPGEKESKYRLMFHENPQPMLIFDRETLQIIEVNRAATHIYGYTADEFIALTLEDIRPAEDIPVLYKMLNNTPDLFNDLGIVRHRKKNGEVIMAEMLAHDITWKNQRARHVLINDVTKRLQGEERLRRNARRNSLLLGLYSGSTSAGEYGMWERIINMLQEITGSRSAFILLMTNDSREIVFTAISDERQGTLYCSKENHPAGIHDLVVQNGNINDDGFIGQLPEERVVDLPDGKKLIIDKALFASVILEENRVLVAGAFNNPAGYNETDRDELNFIAGEISRVVEKRRLENELHEMQKRWQFAVEAGNDGLWDWNVQTGDVFYSVRWKQILGYGETEIANTYEEWENRIHPEDKPGVLKALHGNLHGKSGIYISEHRMKCKDDSWKWILDRGKVLEFSSEGKPLRMVGTVKDITDRKIREMKIAEQLNELQRWHQVTLGRENRIIELKQEVNALLADTGKPIRYKSVL